MEFLFLIAIAGCLAWLWTRVDRLEQRTRWLQEEVDALNFARRQQMPEADETPQHAPTYEAQAAAKPPARPAPAAPSPTVPSPQPTPAAPIARKADNGPAEAGELEPKKHSFAMPTWRPSFDFEDIFGRLLPIWAGGIALAIAGFFLVRWSIENGLLNENVRVALGFVFGTALLAGAEIAHRFERFIADVRIRQALAGAGLATLYASFYLAGSHYGLIGGSFAFAGLAGVTALALAASFRFGLPSAVLGLIGGFAAPALAGSTDPNLPLLATYLALVTGGLTFTGRKQKRNWLGLAALAGGLGWGALMLVSGPVDEAGILAMGGYLVLVGTMLPSLMGSGPLGNIGRIAACGLATLQIAALVDQTGYSLLAWGAYILLAAAIAVLGWQHRRLREAGGIAAALSACLIAAWPDPSGEWLAMISAAMAAIFIGAPMAHVLREKAESVDWAQLALYPLALIAALCVQLWVPLPGGQHMLLALAGFALTIAPAIAAWLTWPEAGKPFAPKQFGAFTAAAAMALVAGLLATPGWAAPFVTLALASALFPLLRARGEVMPNGLQWIIAISGGVLLLVTAESNEMARLVGIDFNSADAINALRWLAAAAPFAFLSNLRQTRHAIRAAQVPGVLLAYGAIAQVVPGDWLPTAVAAGVLTLAWHMRWRAAHATALGLSVLWGLPVLLVWSYQGIEALAGKPMMAMDSLDIELLQEMLLPLIVAWIGSLLLAPRFFESRRKAGWALGTAFALVAAHSTFKMLFGMADMEQFAALGMAERTVWQALLALPAIALLSLPQKQDWQRLAGTSLAALPLAHFAIFSLGWHNPLWDDQAVGSLPIANLLLPAYGIAIACLIGLRGQMSSLHQQVRPLLDGAVMVLLGLLALSELRHAFSGTMLTDTVMSQQEDLLRSILAIALALGFLAWGAWKKQRSWRIGSLVLMLLAVTKVFLFDAAGLEGLARIASFMALGLCLIGIGWFYTRQLKADTSAPTLEEAS